MPAAEKDVLEYHQNRFNLILVVSLKDLYVRDGTVVLSLLDQCFYAPKQSKMNLKGIYRLSGSATYCNGDVSGVSRD